MARLLDMNMSLDARYDTILGLIGVEYDYPLWKKPDFIIRRGYLALGGRATWSEAAPGAGRTTISRSPFSFDASLRLDTKFGLLNISIAYLADILF